MSKGFVLSGDPLKVWWPVKIPVPVDQGEVKIHTIELHFEIIGQDEIDKMTEEKGGILELLTRTNGGEEEDIELLCRVTDGWRFVFDEKKQALDFSEERFRALLNRLFIRKAVVQSYFECVQGRAAKN